MSYAEVDRISKLVPRQLNIKLEKAIQDPELKEVASKEPRVKEVLDVSLKLEGVARNAGMHAAGVVISSVPLMELVPLYVTNKDEIVTQYDMVGLEKLGLLKMDFLGLTTLTIIEEAVKLIERYRGEKIVPRGSSARMMPRPTKKSLVPDLPAVCFNLNLQGCRTFCAVTSPTASRICAR